MPDWRNVNDIEHREQVVSTLSDRYRSLWDDVELPDPWDKTARTITYSQEPGGAFLACLDDDTVAGYDLTLPQTPDRLDELRYPDRLQRPLVHLMDTYDADISHIYHTVLHPDYRGRGIGRTGINKRETMLQEAGHTPDLYVSIVRQRAGGERTPVHRLARRHGYADSGMTFTGGDTVWSLMYRPETDLPVDILAPGNNL